MMMSITSAKSLYMILVIKFMITFSETTLLGVFTQKINNSLSHKKKSMQFGQQSKQLRNTSRKNVGLVEITK